MKESEKLASKFLEEKLQDLGTSIPQYKHLAISLMVKFAREMCEQQKTTCYANVNIDSYTGKGYDVENSILECTNVCDI